MKNKPVFDRFYNLLIIENQSIAYPFLDRHYIPNNMCFDVRITIYLKNYLAFIFKWNEFKLFNHQQDNNI